jgi:threonine/homoserine/homoserine lactone efflux protein
MFDWLWIALLGMGISFLGALPLGTLNITALQIALQQGNRPAWHFAWGVAWVEILYVRLSLTGITWVMQHAVWFDRLQWLSVFVFFLLGLIQLRQSFRPIPAAKPKSVSARWPPWALGMFLSAINPVQIPFWFLWSTSLTASGWLIAKESYYLSYLMGIGVGTLLAMGLFIVGGKSIARRIGIEQRILQRVVGIVFILTACWLLWKLNQGDHSNFTIT